MIERITSQQNLRIKQAVRLHSSRGRQTQGRIIVFGAREIERAIEAGVVFEELFFSDSESNEFVGRFQSITAGSPTQFNRVDDAIFRKIAFGDRTDGVIGIATRPTTELETLSLGPPDQADHGLVVVLQAIEKPGNMGAIFRTADACGATAIICADPLTDVFHPNAIRSSTGTVFTVPSARSDTPRVQQWLRENHFRVVTATLENATDFYQANLTGRIAIVLGNEANGLDAQWQQADFSPVKLPMLGTADSLNVSVTASAMLYEALRQRNGR